MMLHAHDEFLMPFVQVHHSTTGQPAGPVTMVVSRSQSQ